MSSAAWLLLFAAFFAVAGCGGGGTKGATVTRAATNAQAGRPNAGSSGAGGPKKPKAVPGHGPGAVGAGGRGNQHTSRTRSPKATLRGSRRQRQNPGSGSGPIVATKTQPNGVIVIHGGGRARSTYGPFTRQARNYTVSYQQSKATPFSVGVEPKAVSSTGSSALVGKDTRGQGVAAILWRRFYIVVDGSTSAYVLRLVPK